MQCQGFFSQLSHHWAGIIQRSFQLLNLQHPSLCGSFAHSYFCNPVNLHQFFPTALASSPQEALPLLTNRPQKPWATWSTPPLGRPVNWYAGTCISAYSYNADHVPPKRPEARASPGAELLWRWYCVRRFSCPAVSVTQIRHWRNIRFDSLKMGAACLNGICYIVIAVLGPINGQSLVCHLLII